VRLLGVASGKSRNYLRSAAPSARSLFEMIPHWVVSDGAEAAHAVHMKWRFTQETKHGKRVWSDRLVEWTVCTARAHLGKRAGASRVQG
jgi:hypothetical protein